MATTQGAIFLYQFTVGEPDSDNPGVNVISVTSTAAGDHDKANLTTTPLRETWRSANATTTQEIVIQANDLTLVPDVFALLNHNLSANALIKLQGNNTLTWGAPPYSVNMIWNKKHVISVGSIGAAYKYYKITIIDPGNPCGYIEIGKIVAGLSFILTQNEDIQDDFTAAVTDLSYQMKTEGFFRATNERVKVQSLSMTIPRLPSAKGSDINYQGVQAMADFIGTTLPFLVIVDPNDVYFKNIWGQLSKMPGESYTINRFVDLTLDIDEVY